MYTRIAIDTKQTVLSSSGILFRSRGQKMVVVPGELIDHNFGRKPLANCTFAGRRHRSSQAWFSQQLKDSVGRRLCVFIFHDKSANAVPNRFGVSAYICSDARQATAHSLD